MPESSRRTDAPLFRALELARPALAEPPAGLLTDFDGTLSPIVADPALARLVDGAAGPLAALSRRLAVVAVVTGREPLEARRMVGVPGILVAGNHGTEWLEPDAAAPSTGQELAAIRERLDALLARVPPLPGVVLEPKGISASVHYRGSPDPDAAREAILAAVGDVASQGIELRHGRMIVELRPIGLGDKGSATSAIIKRFALRGAVVMGDDLTDLDMFAAVADARDAGALRGVVVAVGAADHEAPPAVMEAADVVLADPAEAALFLALLARD